MAIQKQIWVKDVSEKLFPANTFMMEAINDDAFVDNKTVNLNEAGAEPNVEENRSSFPASASSRTDTSPNYDLIEFTSDPTLIRDIEEIEVNYQKRQSVLRQHIEALNKKIANRLLYQWSATQAANIIRTTGADRAAQVVGATGVRKMCKVEDMVDVNALMDDMDIPEDGRVVCMPSFMYNDLVRTEWKTLLSLQSTGKARIEGGQLTSLLGFKIYKRGKKNIASYTNAGTPVPRLPGAGALTTANAGAIFWHPDFVRRAKGEVKVYADIDKPEYYGSIFSTMARANGRKRYSDETGVVALVETWVS